MTINITNGDCLKLMKDLPDKSVDLFICDLPYGETNCKWDSVIDLDEFWKEFKRLRKSKRTACIHFCSTKFGYTLIKSNEKMFKMDMVWKKRNKTGGLQSRNRPMRNHEMIYFFYEQAPQYNRDTYHKRIIANFDSKLPASVISEAEKEEKTTYGISKDKCLESRKNGFGNNGFEPPNPASVVEEKPKKKLRDKTNKTIYGCNPEARHGKKAFEPPNPASVLEEKPKKNKTIKAKDRKSMGESSGIYTKDKQTASSFDPPNPASVVEEAEREEKYSKEHLDNNRGGAGTNEQSGIFSKENIKKYNKENGVGFTPPNPASVISEAEKEDEHDVWGQSKFSCGGDCGRLNEDGSYKLGYEPPNPASVYESTKVFIGKRHHQTEKPLDILEFFIKYWSDEGHTILDPTMGSGSTGVACKGLKRNFIGFEMNEKIFKVAEDRIKKVEVII